jgi:hypothetical protein
MVEHNFVFPVGRERCDRGPGRGATVLVIATLGPFAQECTCDVIDVEVEDLQRNDANSRRRDATNAARRSERVPAKH